MISRPTTDQIILGCRRELLEVVLPDVQSEHVRVTVQMLENILRNAASRSAHEIAWMREETDALEAYARDVASAVAERGDLAAEAEAALGALATAPRDSLDLADVAETYSRASEAFSCALEAAVAGDQPALAVRAAELLLARNRRELEISGEWMMVGRA